MPVQGVVVVAIAALLAVIAVERLVRAWLKYRGRRVITCPENERPAGVTVDSRHAAASALFKTPELRLSTCSRWPERAGCGQQCLSQIEAAPEDCLVRNILLHWYAGKACAWCGQAIGPIPLGGAKPALLKGETASVEWSEVPAEQLHETLAASLPICFACHMANRLVREHPELAVNRPRVEGIGR